MTDFTAPYDYVVSQKAVGKWKVRRNILIALYIIFPIAFLVLIMATNLGWFGFFIPVTEFMLIFFTLRYVKIDYEYVVESGYLTFSIVQNAFNHRIRKKKMNLNLRSATVIAPKTAEYEGKIAEFAPEIEYNALSCEDAEDRYFALYKDDKGKRCAFYFEATEKMLKICRYYHSDTVVTKVAH
ncbi:MAG: hypothetical protein MJ102_05655 [Clostridia bacterium]|nr:hypothetical protein [Clostridia bacterium]